MDAWRHMSAPAGAARAEAEVAGSGSGGQDASGPTAAGLGGCDAAAGEDGVVVVPTEEEEEEAAGGGGALEEEVQDEEGGFYGAGAAGGGPGGGRGGGGGGGGGGEGDAWDVGAPWHPWAVQVRERKGGGRGSWKGRSEAEGACPVVWFCHAPRTTESSCRVPSSTGLLCPCVCMR